MENIWQAILNLKAVVSTYDAPICTCSVNRESRKVLINESPSDISKNILILCDKNRPLNLAETTTFILSEVGNVTAMNQKGISVAEMLFLQKYLPYCFLSIKAKRLKRAISVTHFAQTLDAKIATLNGDSKWIGNSENLIHAHRMRALCDGVLVGSRTVEADNPRLNVRHVYGNNPIRIVLGHPDSDYKSLIESSDKQILVFGKEKINVQLPLVSLKLEYDATLKTINPKAILEKLFELGIHSIYIEGGAKTTSIFVNAKAVDVLQLHIAPMIFGSGKDGIVLPNIQAVKEAISFAEYHFLPFGDSVMFTGFLPDET